ncbi:hypothetical protein RhiirA4_469012 [Rhizophagus irregularis]|uniref:Uncharacterized protein n=1 Tax=Rhizophagus irregularis TaxID=588596 RepID=A0A2I1GYS3_9GLOM|nr:hypothetical protein RhiirA4_469012 [Rhizophagus irregularis]
MPLRPVHLSTLNAHSYHLPILFTQLKTYQDDEVYNKFYHTSHHKKNPLLQQKLSHLSSSFELSIAISITQHHHRDESARNPKNDCTMYQIDACKHNNFKDDYVQLNDFLSDKSFYNYIDIQQYLSLDITK